MIEKHEDSLLREYESFERKRTKQIETADERVKRHLAVLKSFKKYASEIRQRGTACDVARSASGLHKRAGDLLIVDVTEAGLSYSDVTFTSCNFITDGDNIVGALNFASTSKLTAECSQCMPSTTVVT